MTKSGTGSWRIPGAWKNIVGGVDGNKVVNNKQEQKWEKPSPGYLKLNTDADAEVNPHTNRMSYGWVLRDDVGQFVAASCIPGRGIFTPKEAEAMATRETLGDRTSLSTDPIMKFLPCLLESSSFYHNK